MPNQKDLVSDQQKDLRYLTDSKGRNSDVSCFTWGKDTGVSGSCSLVWQNDFYVFGGTKLERQISEVKGTKLSSIGALDFDHRQGTCDVMGDKIVLCFNCLNCSGESTVNSDHEAEYKRCRVATNPLGEFTEIQNSIYPHITNKIAASDCKSQNFFSFCFLN